MEEAAGPRAERVYNYLQSRRLPIPDISFKHLVTGVRGNKISVWKGTTQYLGKIVQGEGRTKLNCKANIYQSIFDCLQAEDCGGVERTMVLPSPTHIPTKRKAQGVEAKSRQTQKYLKRLEKFATFVLKVCICGKRNFISYHNCYVCGLQLNDVVKPKYIMVFIDIERVAGDLTAPPLSIGVVAMAGDGRVIKKTEIIILPEGDRPNKKNKLDRKPIMIHKMYVGMRNGKKVVLSIRDGKEKILPSVSPEKAAESLTVFMEELGGACNIFFHGEDDRCLLPFLQRHKMIDRFDRIVLKWNNTQVFYKEIQLKKEHPNLKFGMKAIVEDWATSEVKTLYADGAHSAVVDALVLGSISCGQKLRSRFSNFYWVN